MKAYVGFGHVGRHLECLIMTKDKIEFQAIEKKTSIDQVDQAKESGIDQEQPKCSGKEEGEDSEMKTDEVEELKKS